MNSIHVSGSGFKFNMWWFGLVTYSRLSFGSRFSSHWFCFRSRLRFGQHKSTAVNSANESQPVNCWSTVKPRLSKILTNAIYFIIDFIYIYSYSLIANHSKHDFVH
ncbi:hypothetical protein Hanom_Chr07g00583981 [Helianthus anomalus]